MKDEIDSSIAQPDPEWDYAQAWELLHEAIELQVEIERQMGEKENLDKQFNENIFPMLVEASMKVANCSRLISALTEE
ncbi:hypothetical protein [Calothrix sp. CCY 0018]|uniref:hypothetical protein n=1 Tax=Calothrix sp. CCY 0018 TaxID=3103864 RepID=UPI0039C6088A